MNFIRLTTLITVAALAATPLYAQEKPSAKPPGDKQAMMDECKKAHDKHHDQTKEKGASEGMMAKCMKEKQAAKSNEKKAAPDHDKEHKAQ